MRVPTDLSHAKKVASRRLHCCRLADGRISEVVNDHQIMACWVARSMTHYHRVPCLRFTLIFWAEDVKVRP
jgi:hypothetical protein